MSLLDVRELSVSYRGSDVVSALSFSVQKGESVGLVGESGAGKTQTALAIMGLVPASASVTGSIRIDGAEVVDADEATLNGLRAVRMSMVFQDPAQALNPYLCVGRQLRRVVLAHRLADAREADERAVDMLARVGLPDPSRQFHAYPHQLSGGMRQRAMIATALIAEPGLLIADEPTTALDVTVQAQILELLERIREDTALLLITHDLAIVAGHCERVVVMAGGRNVETGPTGALFSSPAEPQTAELVAAAPRFASVEPPPAAEGAVLLDARGVSVGYRVRGVRGPLAAVEDVSLEVRRGETVAVVGESGSGKSSLVRAILGLVPMSAGRVVLGGRELSGPVQQRAIADRRGLQLVFQDPSGSLDPQMRILDIVAEPLAVHEPSLDAAARRDAVIGMLERVGLGAGYLRRFPHELSGGQAQRVAIARALVVNPEVLVCDEAVAALDGSVRRQILDLLRREQVATGLGIVFISHDLAVVRSISHRVLVLYLGRVVEAAAARDLFTRPRHPYTQALLEAVPLPDPTVPGGRLSIRGEMPSIANPPSGCAFHPRCPHADERCRSERPELRAVGESRTACHHAETIPGPPT